ncbi:MAG TPA: hypothetical protein VF733_06300 [Candidatus Saccharimonadales bacterium]
MSETIIATITDVGFDKPHKKVRAACTLKTFEAARDRGITVVAVDAGSPPEYIEQMKRRNVTVIPQRVPGMGSAQRQALQAAKDLTSPSASIVWTESEKYPLIPLLSDSIAIRNHDQYDLVMFKRNSLASYPPEQAMSYNLISLATRYLLNIENDFGWGPTILSSRAIDYYTSYESLYGDSWDAIHCPKLHIMKDGLPWTILPIAYEHPPEQTVVETGMTMFMKRIEQAQQLVGSISKEVERIGLCGANIQFNGGKI